MTPPTSRRRDAGSAVVEFVLLTVVLLVPLVYVVLALLRVQATAYAATQAVREAGRAYVQAATPAEGQARAAAAVRLALADQGVDAPPGALTISCPTGPCLAPGGRVEVALALVVALPLLPDWFGAPGGVPVRAVHVAPVDEYRSER